jgi:hypothetical protein
MLVMNRNENIIQQLVISRILKYNIIEETTE